MPPERTLLIFAGLASSLANFRGPLIAAMVVRGHQVHAAAPGLTSDAPTHDWLREQRVVCHDVPLSRAGQNPVADLQSLVALWRLMRAVQSDLFLGYTIKPVIWGTLAAWMARVPQRVVLITGLGYAFTGQASGKRALVQKAARWL